MPKLPARAKQVIAAATKPKEPVWRGPCSNHEQGGVTQSLISRFLSCPERFRLKYIEGWKPQETFNLRTEYGNYWHEAEKAYSESLRDPTTTGHWKQVVEVALKSYAEKLLAKYRLQQPEIDKWYQVARVQFPIYVDYWKKHQDKDRRVSLLEEKIFSVPYILDSGRIVYLRGKWDGVSIFGTGKNAGVYLLEYKTKGDLDMEALQRQLTFDNQTMMYLVALKYMSETPPSYLEVNIPCWTKGVVGVHYVVVRRPLSGGRHSIKRHQATTKKRAETHEEYYNRLAGLIESEPEYFFARWKVDMLPGDIERYRKQTLDPILERLCDWYECITECSGDNYEFCKRHRSTHYRHPFGADNYINEGYGSGIEDLLETGSKIGLSQTTNLFPELME